MKLIIEVNKEDLDFIRKTFTQDAHDYIPMVIKNRFVNAVLNGTPIPDNVTNGDVIMSMFPNANVYEHNGGATYSVNNEYNFNATWWNAPYQKGGKE